MPNLKDKGVRKKVLWTLRNGIWKLVDAGVKCKEELELPAWDFSLDKVREEREAIRCEDRIKENNWHRRFVLISEQKSLEKRLNNIRRTLVVYLRYPWDRESYNALGTKDSEEFKDEDRRKAMLSARGQVERNCEELIDGFLLIEWTEQKCRNLSSKN